MADAAAPLEERSRDRHRHRSRSRSRSRHRSHRHRSRSRERHRSSRDAEAPPRASAPHDERREEDRHRHRHRERSRRHRSRSRSYSRSPPSRHRDRSSAAAPSRAAPPPAAAAAAASAAAAAAASAAAAALAAAIERKQRRKPGKEEEAEAARVASLFGYTAEDNPFGDANLTQQFVWRKKLERDITSGKLAVAPTAEDVARSREELAEEITRAKERRVKREAERGEMERLRAEEDRLRDAEQHAGWEAKEEAFHRRQAATRSLVRIREGREKPVDALARNLVLFRAIAGEDPEARGDAVARGLEIREPCVLLQRLGLPALLELRTDAAALGAIDEGVEEEGMGGTSQRIDPLRATAHEFWSSLHIVISDYIVRARARASGLARGSSLAVLESVEEEVDAMFEGKSLANLIDMAAAVQAILTGGGGGGASSGGGAGGGGGGDGSGHAPLVSVGLARGGAVDFEYWSSVAAHLAVAQAKARLLAAHEHLLDVRVSQLEANEAMAADVGGEGRGVGGGAERGGDLALPSSAAIAHDVSLPLGAASAVATAAADSEEAISAAAAAAAATAMFVGDDSSLLHTSARAAMAQRIRALRARGVIRDMPPAHGGDGEQGGAGGKSGGAAGDTTDFGAVFDEKTGLLLPSGVDTAEFPADAEVHLPPVRGGSISAASAAAAAAQGPSDKYRPRKPRYFNRVKTGYDWNKYNKTHYDRENPPPKTVQGYQFNIFYPDLLDRTRTPTFSLEPADTDDYILIRFSGGPPYEDLAFKVVHKEWEYSRKHGFRCTFDRGVLQLHVNFKRSRYRA